MTERCDLACRYCRTGREPAPDEKGLPSLDRLAGAVEWAVRRLGVSRVKLTGGEPLLRPGVVDFVRRLAAGPGIDEISMTTNGTRLAGLAFELARAGLARVNVSLDALDPARFSELTRGGDVGGVLAGIDTAISAGLSPVKLNAVLRRSSFERDVPALLAFAARRGIEVRFIELMRTGEAAAFADDEFVSSRAVRARLGLDGTPGPAASGAGPARRLRVRFGTREVTTGWIEPVSHSFCGGCSRLRLDAHGVLRRCLMDAEPFPLLDGLEDGSRPGVAEGVGLFLAGKRPPVSFATPRPMAAIGG